MSNMRPYAIGPFGTPRPSIPPWPPSVTTLAPLPPVAPHGRDC
jgi:hypothetical protein